MKHEPVDVPFRLLSAAIRAMPEARAAWGAAMLAEIAYVDGALARWRFALSCLPVALFPPPGGDVLTMKTNKLPSVGANFTSASIISLALVAPLMLLELQNNGVTWQRASDNAMLFGVLWVLPMTFVITAMPVVRAFRAGQAMVQNRPAFASRIVVLALAGAVWFVIVTDQWPCFVGAPNCD